MKHQLKRIIVIFLFIAVQSVSISPLTYPIFAQTEITNTDVDSAILKAVNYLKTQQNEDGGIRWIDESSSVAASIRTVLALSAVGLPIEVLTSPINLTPFHHISAQGADWIFQRDTEESSFSVARAGQLLAAVAAVNQDPHAFGSEELNLPHLILSHYDPNTGVYGIAAPNDVTDQVWAIIGLSAAYASVPQDAVTWLARAQQADGSWDDGFGSYLDTTPLATMALLASGIKNESDPEIQLAKDFIMENQQPNGGWQTAWDNSTNANTTGILLQSLYAAGMNPAESPWIMEEGSPLTALLRIQQDNGAIGGDFINAFSTADAILGLSGRPLYDLGTLRRVGRAFESIFAAQGEDGGWGNAGQTLDVILAASAAGWDPDSITHNDQSPFVFISGQMEDYLQNGPDAIGKTVLALAAAGKNPETFNGINLIETLLETYDPDTKAFGNPENTWHQALAILGLKAANAEIPEEVIQTLANLQRADGGWEYTTGFGTWPDNTALALQALHTAGFSTQEDPIQKGLAYLQSQQLTRGAWGDSSTTAFVVMGLNALGITPDEWRTESNHTPIQDLLSYQNLSGAFRFSDDFPEDSLLATTAAVFAVLGGNYHIQTVAQVPDPAAGLVIHTDTGEITTACVHVEGESTSGLALLDTSGIPYQAQDGFMNSIMNLSNPQGGTLYWSYWHWDGREWVFNNTGAGDSVVLPGSIEAWYFTSWEQFPSQPPEYVPHVNVICGENQAKNYAVQPYINYYDLHKPSVSAQRATVFLPNVEIQTTSAPSSVSLPEVESRPITPIIIIGVVGVIILAFIIWLSVRKK